MSPLSNTNKKTATGLSSRSVLARMSEIQMLDVVNPVTDGRELRMKRYTKPEKTHHLLLNQLGFTLPVQPPSEIRNPAACGGDLLKKRTLAQRSPPQKPPNSESRANFQFLFRVE